MSSDDNSVEVSMVMCCYATNKQTTAQKEGASVALIDLLDYTFLTCVTLVDYLVVCLTLTFPCYLFFLYFSTSRHVSFCSIKWASTLCSEWLDRLRLKGSPPWSQRCCAPGSKCTQCCIIFFESIYIYIYMTENNII